VTSHSEKAVALFGQGYNCAQATLAAFAEELRLDVDLALRFAAGLGAGRAAQRETCGPVTAMAIIVGLAAGSLDPGDLEARRALYARIRAMEAEFLRGHGSTCCRELLGRAGIVAGPDPSPRTPEYYKTRPCARLVATAADIVSAMLAGPDRLRSPR
jgi:C_GCAxxG_C_C family probable redox protein